MPSCIWAPGHSSSGAHGSSAGEPNVTLAQSLRLRLEREQSLLLQAYPTARITFDTLVVVLPDYPLPAGWSQTATDVLFAIPPNYPVGQPDNICTRPDLTLQGGGAPGN